jgi:hypothetical protein
MNVVTSEDGINVLEPKLWSIGTSIWIFRLRNAFPDHAEEYVMFWLVVVVSQASIHIFVNVLCHREQLGVHPCDRRRTISEYRTLFPTVDWSLMTDEKDVQWTSDKRETEDEITARGCQFLSMVMK